MLHRIYLEELQKKYDYLKVVTKTIQENDWKEVVD